MTRSPAANQPVLGRIAAVLRPYRAKLALVAVAVVTAATLTSIVPFLTKAVFDDALFPKTGPPDLGLLGWLVAGMCVIPIVAALISIGQNWLTSTVGNSAMADLRSELFAHLQKMELAFFTATKTGAIQSRLANDVAGVRTVLTDTATSILQNSVTVIAAFIAMVLLSWQLTVLTLILMPVFIVVQMRVGKRRQRLARKTQESLSEMTAITEEALSVSGILLSKVFNRADAEVGRYRDANREQARLQVEQAMTGRAFFATVQASFAITPALLYLVAGLMISGGTSLTAGTLVAFTTRAGPAADAAAAAHARHARRADVTGPVPPHLRVPRPRAGHHRAARRRRPRRIHAARRDRVQRRLVPVPRAARAHRHRQPRPLRRHRRPHRASEETADLDEQDGTSGWALRGVSFKVQPGQLAAIVGPSGAGKTTMTYLVPRFYDVSEGAVLIDGHDVRDLTLGSVSEAVGMVTQEPYLFHGTIRDNIAYAKPDATAAEIEQAARDANIHDRILGFADGYETITGERGYRLSGGEKQRLAIARVLLMDPRILILDEATSALDTETERLVQEALERATHNRTTIAIAHRLSTIRSADVIFGIEDGVLVEQGSHEELLEAGGLYARLYIEQFGSGQIEARFTDGVRFADGSLMCERKDDERRADVSF